MWPIVVTVAALLAVAAWLTLFTNGLSSSTRRSKTRFPFSNVPSQRTVIDPRVISYPLPRVTIGPPVVTILVAQGGMSPAASLYFVNPRSSPPVTQITPILLAGGLPVTITGLAEHPITRILYAATATFSPNITNHLITINTNTGLATDVGPLVGASQINDITFRSDGVLYGTAPLAGMGIINITNGTVTLLNSQPLISSGNGTSFLPLLGSPQTLWVVSGSTPILYSVDQVTGIILTTTALAPPLTARCNALTALGVNLLGSLTDGSLVSINPLTGTTTVIGGPGYLPTFTDAIAVMF